MQKLKLTQIGNSIGVILPAEVLERLQWVSGDEVQLVEIAGGIVLSTRNPEAEEPLEMGRRFMRDYREAFRRLAK